MSSVINQPQMVLIDLDGTLIDTDDQMVDQLARRLQPLLRDRSRPLARWMLMRAEGPGNRLIRMLDLLGIEQPMIGVTDWLHKRRGLPRCRRRILCERLLHRPVRSLHGRGVVLVQGVFGCRRMHAST